MNEKGIGLFNVIFFFFFILAAAVYFSGIYQSLLALGIGSPLFFQILGTMIVIVAFLALFRGPGA